MSACGSGARARFEKLSNYKKRTRARVRLEPRIISAPELRRFNLIQMFLKFNESIFNRLYPAKSFRRIGNGLIF